jgi:hypothetical protein
MTADAAASSVIKTELVMRYTLPTPTRAPLTTASKAAVRGPPSGDGGVLADVADTGAEMLTITPSDRRGRVSDAPLPHKAPGPPRS